MQKFAQCCFVRDPLTPVLTLNVAIFRTTLTDAACINIMQRGVGRFSSNAIRRAQAMKLPTRQSLELYRYFRPVRHPLGQVVRVVSQSLYVVRVDGLPFALCGKMHERWS